VYLSIYIQKYNDNFRQAFFKIDKLKKYTFNVNYKLINQKLIVSLPTSITIITNNIINIFFLTIFYLILILVSICLDN